MEFERWLSAEEKLPQTCRREQVALTFSMGGEAEAFDYFFKMFDRWQTEKNQP